VAMRTLVLIGTDKGGFTLELDAAREPLDLRGPFNEAMPIRHLAWDPSRGVLLGAAGSPWYGPIVWRSEDLGETWSQSSDGLTYGDGEADEAVTRVWNLTAIGDTVYAGVEPAGLFRSDDGGRSWSHVAGLREHPSRPSWEPGNGGLILHTIVGHPQDPQQMWVGISAVGIFHTSDGGETWVTCNEGVGPVGTAEERPETGYCVHKFGLHPSRPDVLFQQNHSGAYRSDDGGRHWVSINDGLPSTFGFGLALHPHDPHTLWTIPLNGDAIGRYMPGGAAAVWQSRDDGASWTAQREGLPQHGAFVGVLREATATDTHDPAGVYFGTSTGQLFGSPDEGGSWRLLADYLPRISSVETVILED
jgi:photosystem II stability/assembly factor-like uncharacterized protein